MFTKEEEKKLRAELVETFEYQKTNAAIQYYRDNYNSAPILDVNCTHLKEGCFLIQ